MRFNRAGTHEAWLEVDLGTATRLGRVMIDEAYEDRVRQFAVQYKDGEEWQDLFTGTTIGRNFQRVFRPVNRAPCATENPQGDGRPHDQGISAAATGQVTLRWAVKTLGL